MSDGCPGVGDVIGGKYAIEATIGRGGMGAVFRARHTLTDRQVALKWLLPSVNADPSATQRFLREARAMGRIDHPNVVGVLDVGTEGGSVFLVMELLRGGSLRELLLTEPRIEPSRAVALLLPALDGVAAAHRAGVVHRDLKPENLLVVVDEHARVVTTKVLDFGISKLRDDDKTPAGSEGAITRTGTTMGTPSYMSPEQVRGARDIDARTDVWALGAILYEMLTGRVPFVAETYGGLMVAIAVDPLVPVDVLAPDVPRELARAVDRALEKDPGRRHPDVESFHDALATHAAHSVAPPVVSRPPIASAVALTHLAVQERSTHTPTRPARGRPSEDPPASHAGVAIELDSAALRDVAPHGTGMSVSDLSSRPPSARRPRLLLALAIACALPLAAIAVHRASRPTPTEPPSTTARASTAPPEAARPVAVTAVASHDAGTEAVARIAPPASDPTLAPVARTPPETTSIVPRARPAARRRDAGVAAETAATEPPPASRERAPTGRTGQLSTDEF